MFSIILIYSSVFNRQPNFLGEASDHSSNVEDLEAHPDDATTLVLGGGEDVAVLSDVDDQQEDSETLGLYVHSLQWSILESFPSVNISFRYSCCFSGHVFSQI